MLGGALSDRHQEKLSSLGVLSLGSDYGSALGCLEQVTPAYGGP